MSKRIRHLVIAQLYHSKTLLRQLKIRAAKKVFMDAEQLGLRREDLEIFDLKLNAGFI